MKSTKPIRPPFDLVDLTLFANVAARESLTRGALDTALSLAAASSRIRSMEQAVGAELFIRNRRGVTLTPAGKVFRQGAEEILRNLQLMHDGIQDVLNSTAGHVRIVANILAVTDVLPNMIGDYLRMHPEVTVDLEEALSADIVRMVRQGHADMGIAIGDIESAEDLEIFPYRSFHWALVVPSDHPLAGETVVGFVDALRYDFIGQNAETGIFTVLDHFARRRSRTLRIRAKLGSFDGMCRMVAAGVGISVVPLETALRHAHSMDIKVIEIADHWAHRQMQICVRRDWAMPPFARDLLDLLLGKSFQPLDESPSNVRSIAAAAFRRKP